tara:strand:- start:12 stop:641 length:630 start_codon:yes stop_codon:yes gene_type:complete
MARVNSTTKETDNNFNVSNGTGAQVRAGINDIFTALRTINSASGDPSGAGNVVQFQPHIDSSTNLLKICTSVSSGTGTFTTIGNITQANLGLAPVAGATFTGKVTHNYTSSLTIPSGTTAQRDGSPAVGMFRHNSTLNQFEGYNNGAWGAIGGGAGATGGGTDEVFFESDTNVTTNYTITSGKNAHTVSPVINSGVTVTVPSGSLLVII